MKTLNTIELDCLIETLSFLKGVEFQSVLGTRDVITLKFWNEGPVWLTFNLLQNKPFFIGFQKETPLSPQFLKKAEKKPLNIFLRTHFKGQMLTRIERLKDYGRLVRFYFGESEDLFIEFRVYPGGLNLTAFREKKSVSWRKPTPLEKVLEEYTSESVRSPTLVFEEALDFLNSKILKTKVNLNDKFLVAQKKIEEGLEFLISDGYKRFSDALTNQVDLSGDLEGLYRDKLNLRENIEWGYKQQKLKEVKVERLQKRLTELFLKINNKLSSQVVKSKSSGIKAKTRSLEISAGVRAFCGKSAKENMELLRLAKSWHIWMHLKDYPSGHLILNTPRNYVVTERELRECGLFLFKVAAPKKLHSIDNVKFEVIFTESKFVRPIKGAKKGLVQPIRTQFRLYEWSKKNQIMY